VEGKENEVPKEVLRLEAPWPAAAG
jgi:hypothetical protein